MLAAASALLLVIEERRFSILALLTQYLLLSLFTSSYTYGPIFLVPVGLGLAVCFILYVTATHVQGEPSALRQLLDNTSSNWRTSPARVPHTIGMAGIEIAFRLNIVALAGLTTYGAWRAYPLAMVPTETNLAGYWLISIGLLLILTSLDPLRMGLGALTIVNGFMGIYVYLEQSLVVISLLAVVNILIALAISACSESWLESLKGETSR